jgi:mannose-6-phosphate isomerase-like protein (cupin superfamily)
MSTETIERTGFPLEEYADELDAAAENTQIGHEVWFENDRIRIWGINLAPGERVPFHCHQRTYFWVCVDGARGRQRYPSGDMDTFDFAVGDVDFLDIAPGDRLIHDLENSGDSPLRFVAIELLDGGA